MDFRHEWKFPVNEADLIVLRPRLRAILSPDTHAQGGCYTIRSLYFDTPNDDALRDKIESVNRREKFRMRYYDGDTAFINLEKKFKVNGLGNKRKARLTAAEAQAIVDGDTDWMRGHSDELVRELYVKMRTAGLRPKTIVDYTREPFTYRPGNVRVTLDTKLRTGLGCTDFLNPHCITIPASDAYAVLEVKWDGFLPDVVRAAVSLPNRRVSAFSKYAECRRYG